MPPKDDRGKDVAEKGVPRLDKVGDIHINNTPLEIKRITRNLREHFSHNQEWEYEKMIARGPGSLSVVVKRKHGNIGGRRRRIIVKRGTSLEGDRDLKIEMAWLEQVRGAAHIGTMIACRADTNIPGSSAITTGLPLRERLFSKTGNVRRGLKKLFGPKDIEEELNLREMAPYPVIILEHMDQGFLDDILRRAVHYNTFIPNRILWSFFLCKVIPRDGTPRSSLVHNMMHTSSFMISREWRFDEHLYPLNSPPMLRLIEFGSASETGDDLGYQFNLWDIAGVMMTLVTRNVTWALSKTSLYRGIRTEATPIVNENQENYPMIDDQLRDLLARCLAQNVQHRPNLEELLREVEHAVRTKTNPEAFSWNLRPLETNESVIQFLERCLYDADVVPGQQPPLLGDEYLTPATKTPRQRAREEREIREHQAKLAAEVAANPFGNIL
ncbi:uncharacterized protein F4807DRAFT_456893 [Annulohypoxylon truncatum]|uniref:uncharacterized protein n=1 Tax=Annulohypoxylon truncatum TaxID=327061 RepID=UPI00200898DA|nr:uncharacterized protein F4807DRAFT_456893 [Annulohypoxylon truncatum]KAI1213547.1 hypothetical protein F4807DRAFT_456893 [Annulohypoxylon truncatum]